MGTGQSWPVAVSFCKHYTGHDLNEIGSVATAGVMTGRNRVVGLWGHPLSGSWPLDLTPSFRCND